FLDDLQWSDLAALKLIEQLAIDNELSDLLILGAYRDHEVPPDHLLNQIVRAIEESGRVVARHTLQPLDLDHTAALVRDTLTPSPRDTSDLVRVIQTKTEGNPFFVRVLLSSLYEQGVLRFDRSAGGWSWDDAEVASARISDDIVALMSARIGELAPATRNAIEHAACLGNRFTLELLAIITEQEPRIVARDLWEALERGLVQALGDSYKYVGASSEGSSTTLTLPHDIEYRFVHDKVQHAAYSRLEVRRRQEIHLRVGRLLLARAESEGEELGERLFTVTAHLAAAAPLITAPAERLNLARLNLAAGRRAKLAIAYRSAVSHLRSGIDLLPDEAWRDQYDLTFALHRELMESEYLGGNVEAALVLFQPLVARARTDLERAQIYELKVSLETYRKQNSLALSTAFEGLAQLGVHLPQTATVPIVLVEFLRVQLARRWRAADDLTDLPELHEPRKTLLQRLLTTAVPAAYFVDTKLAALILLKSARISLRDGYTDMSAFGVAGYGFVLSGVFGRHDEAYEFGKLALRLNERFKNSWLDVKLDFLVGLFIANWVEPFAAARRRLHRSYQQGIQQGDLAFALYSGVMYINVALVEGQTVDRIYGLAESMEPTAQRAGEIDGIAMLSSIKRMCMALRGQTLQPTRFDTVDWAEADFAAGLDDKTTPQAMFYYNLHKLIALYLFGEFEAAREVSGRLEARLETVLAQPASADFVFYDALTAAARYGAASRSERRRIRTTLARATKKLRRWSGFCPNNFAARLLIVRAEQSRVLGRRDAFILYNQAIQTARTHESIICEALALEMTARYALTAGYEVAVESYATAACDAYRRWGARAKVEQLSQEFGDHFPIYALPPAPEEPEETQSSSATMTSTAQDLDRVSRTFQSIVDDLNLDGLLTNMTQTLTEFTGARHCVVLLERDGALTVEAEGGLPPMSVQLGRGRAPSDSTLLCAAIVKYVARTHEPVLLTNAAESGDFTSDPYIKSGAVRSVLCAPMLLRRDDLVGVIYLENGLAPDVFRHEHVAALAQLLPPVAVAIRTAMRANSYRRFVPHAALDRLAERVKRELRPGDHVNIEGTVQALSLRGTAAIVGDGRGMRSALALLNRFFDAAAMIVERHGGFVAERSSDSLTACYPGGSGPALTAATELLEIGHELFMHREHASRYAGVDIGIALHAGPVTVGAVGSDRELSLVMLSRTVTIARAMARRCDSYGASLILSEAVKAQLPETGHLEIRALNRLDPDDGGGSIQVYEVFSAVPGEGEPMKSFAERFAQDLHESLEEPRAELPGER
ncbi:MAG: GAF domain-containing protein, partial [Myxococcales bacterium]|nr:GAF domain-containing protein [Myxococcales bacterium]